MSGPVTSTTNEMLGYPPDARLLLVNADDLGMYAAINEGVMAAFREGIVRSTSLMAPCPAAAEAMELLRDTPDLPFAVHLSVIRDIDHYQWGPMAPKDAVPSLLADAGNLYTLRRMTEMLQRATIPDLETEFRAQIEAVLATGLRPTHLDWHCLHSGGRADIFDLTLGLAREYGLALRVGSHPFIEQVQSQGLPSDDHDLLDSFAIPTAEKPDRYHQLLRALPAGLTEWAVHPSTGSAESQTIDPDGWPVRSADFAFLISPEAREIIEQEGIILIDYVSLQRVWREKSAVA